MNHLTYFNWTELRPGDLFRFAGYNDVLLKLDDKRAKSIGLGPKPNISKQRHEELEIAPNVGGLILAIG